MENVMGETPPVAKNDCVLLTVILWVTGEICKAGFTVTIASETCPAASVTRTVVKPALPGAVKTPVVSAIEPLPEKIE